MPLAVITGLIVIGALVVLVHLAVYTALAAAFGIGSGALHALFIALSFTFIATMFLGRWVRSKILDWLYTAFAYWLGLVFFFLSAAALFYFTATILYLHNIYISPALLGGIYFGALFLLHLYGTWTATRAQITRIKIAFSGLPAAWEGKRIVFVSDIHLGNVWGRGFSAKIVRKIQALNPEAVLIGGDIYEGPKCDVREIIEPFRSLRAPRGVYFITGNHEYYMPDVEVARAAIRRAGMRILNNEKVDLNGITLVGVDYKTGHKKEDFKNVLAAGKIPKDKPAILLYHEPIHLEAARAAGISLALYGHTHAGQIFPLNYITRTMYRGFDYGLKRKGDMQAYTSSGAGTWGPPLRLGTKSEIVLLEFVHDATTGIGREHKEKN